MDRSSVLVVMVAAILVIDAIALASPATDSGYLPIRPTTAEPDQTVVVERGDHLWRISERYLRKSKGTDPTDAEVSPYWRQTIETNVDHLRSGDPDLIYPGEKVRMPPPP